VVVVVDEPVEQPPQVPLVERNQVIQAFPADRPNCPFGDRVRSRRLDRVNTLLIPSPAAR
jgi:hypothetical protein